MTKKPLLCLLLSLLLFSTGFAHDPRLFTGFPLVDTDAWTPVQVTVWPVTLFSVQAVYGINLAPGLLSFERRVYGISLTLMGGAGKLYGVHCGLFGIAEQSTGLMVGLSNYCKSNRGVIIGLINFSSDSYDAAGSTENLIQLGVFNQAENGLQIGLLNYNPNALVPWMPLVNFSR